MCRECRERFPRHWLQWKPLVSDPDMSGSLTRGGGESVPGIPGACATRKFTHLVRCPFHRRHLQIHFREWKILYFDSNFTEICSYGLIDNTSALVQLMVWRRTGARPLPESMVTQFCDAYICGTGERWVNHNIIMCRKIDSWANKNIS